MKILALHNTNPHAIELFSWLKQNEDEVILFSERLEYDWCKSQGFDFLVSYTYDYKIPLDILNLFNGNAINLHISYLPWNKGFSPNIWSFLEQTPKGVTIHKLSAGIDEGDILFQKEIKFDDRGITLKESYDILNIEIINLFKRKWGFIKEGLCEAYKQCGNGSKHTKKDLEALKRIIDFEWDDNVSEVIQKYRSRVLD